MALLLAFGEEPSSSRGTPQRWRGRENLCGALCREPGDVCQTAFVHCGSAPPGEACGFGALALFHKLA